MPTLTFVETRNNRQSVIFWNNIEKTDEYVKFKQFNMSASEVDFYMQGPLKEVQAQIKKILEVED